MTNLEGPGQVVPLAPAESKPPKPKTIRPVLFWSSIGVVCVMAAAYVYTAWIVSGDATPVSAGPDRIPAGTRAAMAAFQVLCPVFAVAAVFYVVRKSLRERQLCVEAAIVIGSTVAWWHDP